MITQIIILIMLVLLSGVFSSTEIAMFSLSKLKVRHLVENKRKNAKLLQKLKFKSHKLLITILIGNNVVNIAAASIATAIAIDLFDNAGIGIATGIMTLIILIVGEIVPKAFATKHAQTIALGMAPVINVMMQICYPLVYVFDKLTSSIVPADENIVPRVSEEEVRDIVDLSGEQGSIKELEKEMIQNIFDLDDTTVDEIMTPRPGIIAFESNLTVDQVIVQIKQTGLSRIPIYEGELDNTLGFIHAKDLLAVNPNTPLKELLRRIFFVPETKRVDQLLREFKSKKMHLAMIVNEHGTIVGLITIEDLLEEIVGEIYDETDSKEELEEDVKKINDTEFLIKGWAELDDVEEALEIEIHDDDNTTISGFIMRKMNRIPQVEERFRYEGYLFVVKKVENQRIELVLAKKIMNV